MHYAFKLKASLLLFVLVTAFHVLRLPLEDAGIERHC